MNPQLPYVVLDTSVVVAAARSKRGASSLLIEWMKEARFTAVVSHKLVLEYEKVLKRDVQGPFLNADDVTRLVDFMVANSMHVDPAFLLRPELSDPDDDFVLELAFAASVDYLITHNTRDFGNAGRYGVRVVAPGEFVRLIRGES